MRFIIFLGITLLFACKGGNNSNNTVPESADVVLTKAEISIEGMTCTGCEKTVETKISELNGVNSIKASHVTKNAVIEYDINSVDTTKLISVIVDAGYTVTGHRIVVSDSTAQF